MRVNMGQPNNDDILIDDLELLLREIDEFNTAVSNNKPVDIPQTLDKYLQFVAKCGNTIFPWPHVRMLFRTKMMAAIQQFQEPLCPTESFILERFDMFRVAAPFTIQRLAELVLQPTRHYRKKEKFLRGLEKTVLVVTTVEPRSLTGEDEKNGNDDGINTSGSSGEGEPGDSVTFNRTFTMDHHEMVTVRSSPIDILTQNMPISAEEHITLDPVTTSVVSTAVDVINHSIGVVSDGLIGDSVTTSSMDVITPDIPIVVSSESIILNADASTGIANIGTADGGLASAMECESSTTAIDVSPVTLLQCVTEQDLVSTAAMTHTSETLPQTANVDSLEDVSSSLVNMDAVKLPLPLEDSHVSVDCHSSAAPETTEASSMFHVVTQIPEDPALVTPLLGIQTCVESSHLSSGESEPALVDVPTLLISSDKSEATDEFEQQGSVEPVASELERKSSEELSSVAPPQILDTTPPTTDMDVSADLPETGEKESELESATEVKIPSSEEVKKPETATPDVSTETPAPSSDPDVVPNIELSTEDATNDNIISTDKDKAAEESETKSEEQEES